MLQYSSANLTPGAITRPDYSGRLVVFFAILAALITALIYEFVFLRTPITTDETSYVFQAYAFLEGKISRPLPPIPNAFAQEMFIMDERAGWMSRYPPGHSFWLTPGCAAGWPHLMAALAAGLSLWFIARTAGLFNARAMTAAGVMLLLSPFFLFTHGTLLSHTSGLLATALFLYGFFRWQYEGAARFAALAAAGWGWLYINRSYTAVWLALPFGLYVLMQLKSLWRDKTYWRGIISFAGVAAGFMLVLLAYNYCALGDPFTLTYLYYDPSETPGFGLKHTRYSEVMHTPLKGLTNLARNLNLYDRWLFGFRGSLVIALLLALTMWPRETRLCGQTKRRIHSPCALMLSGAGLVWTAYVFFYYYGRHETGPIYFFETLPLIIVPAAVGFARLIDRIPRRGARRAALIAAGAAVLGASVYFMAGQKEVLQKEYGTISKYLALFRSAPDQALILVDESVPFSNTHSFFFLNRHGLKSRPLVARSLNKMDKLLLAHFPERIPYRLSGKELRLIPVRPEVLAYELEARPDLMHGRTGRPIESHAQKKRAAREADAARDEAGWMAFGVQWPVYRGKFEASFELVTGGAASEPVVTLEIASDAGLRQLAQTVIQGAATGGWHSLTFTAEKIMKVEPRVYFHGRGKARLGRIRLREILSAPADIAKPPAPTCAGI
ncbi:MAG: hypothetical protein PHP98_06640 [Kiritimatiellae bacterium]|nr:hypothetical protein [Kiritimatiellia bacterium]